MTAAGAAAEHVIASADSLAGVPRRLPLAALAGLPLVGLTAWQALFDLGKLKAGQRVLINGASDAVGNCAVQLAKEARAHVIVATDPWSAAWLRADEVVDSMHADLMVALREPVDLLLNLAPISPDRLAALLPLVRDGGALVSAPLRGSIPSDEQRSVRGVVVTARSDSDQLADLVARVSTNELVLDVAQLDLADLPALHARAAARRLRGKIVVRVRPT